MKPDWTIEWVDGGREPKCPPNPRYPDGLDLDISHGAERTCSSPLTYPTPRCGYFVVSCRVCGFKTIITTAGRPDDPRTLKMPCKLATGTAQ